MIFIALGTNLPSQHGTPVETLKAAVFEMEAHGMEIMLSSRMWLTAPVPFDAEQPWYHNAVVAIATDLSADDLLTQMLAVEEKFGRVRSIKNAPRVLDLDLIAYNDKIIHDGERLIVPHPRMHKRLFVLNPLAEIDKNWLHPKVGQTVQEMIDLCDNTQQAKVLAEGLYDKPI